MNCKISYLTLHCQHGHHGSMCINAICSLLSPFLSLWKPYFIPNCSSNCGWNNICIKNWRSVLCNGTVSSDLMEVNGVHWNAPWPLALYPSCILVSQQAASVFLDLCMRVLPRAMRTAEISQEGTRACWFCRHSHASSIWSTLDKVWLLRRHSRPRRDGALVWGLGQTGS